MDLKSFNEAQMANISCFQHLKCEDFFFFCFIICQIKYIKYKIKEVWIVGHHFTMMYSTVY